MEILIAENQSKVRFALTVLIGETAGWNVVGTVSNPGELLAALPALKPDVVLLNWNLPGMALLDLVKEIRRTRGSLKIIMVGADPEVRKRALSQGVDFFVSMVDSPDRLTDALTACSRK